MRRAKADDRGAGVAPDQQSIKVELYHDLNTPIEEQALTFTDVGKIYVAEELCIKVVEHFSWNTMSVYLFALFDTEEREWLPPDKAVHSQRGRTKRLKFRMRFIPALPKIPSLDAKTLHYLYFQCRHDFVQDKIIYKKSKDIGQQHLLGLGVTDMVRHGKERGIDLEKLKNMDPNDFIPVSPSTLNHLLVHLYSTIIQTEFCTTCVLVY